MAAFVGGVLLGLPYTNWHSVDSNIPHKPTGHLLHLEDNIQFASQKGREAGGIRSPSSN